MPPKSVPPIPRPGTSLPAFLRKAGDTHEQGDDKLQRPAPPRGKKRLRPTNGWATCPAMNNLLGAIFTWLPS